MRRPRPIWQTHLYVNRSRTGRRVAVMMFATQADMRAWHRAWAQSLAARMKTLAIGPHTVAQASWFGREVPGLPLRAHGVVWLHAQQAGSGVVAHEMSHVAHYATFYGGAKRPERVPGPIREWDEQVAWLTGWLVTQYWRKWWASGLSRDAD